MYNVNVTGSIFQAVYLIDLIILSVFVFETFVSVRAKMKKFWGWNFFCDEWNFDYSYACFFLVETLLDLTKCRWLLMINVTRKHQEFVFNEYEHVPSQTYFQL